jgi:type IV secretion system protein VirB6
MFAPIGTFVTRFDGAMSAGMDGIVSAMINYVSTPLALCAALYYTMQGVKLANGDASPLNNFVPQLVRVGLVLYLSTNLATFNYWVRDVFFTGIPNALATAISSSSGPAANSVASTAAIFDNVWNQMWVIIGTAWMQIGFSVTGVISGIAGIITGLFGGLGLLFLALVYIVARMTLAAIVCVFPAIIGCAIFDATRPIFERAVGKMIALVILQVIGFVILQMVMLGNQWFMVQATNAIITASTNTAVFAEAIQVMLAIAVWFLAGAYVMWNVQPIAYSIGTGIALSGPSLYALSFLGRGGDGGWSAPSIPAPGPPPPLSLSMARPELGSQAPAALPPPPPLAITHSNRS